MLKRITRKLKKVWAETTPPASTRPTRTNPFAEIVGRLSLRNAGTLRRNLFALLARRNRTVALDCSNIRFMDGSALAVLLEFAGACLTSGVNLRLLDPSTQMSNAFSMYGLDQVLVRFSEYNETELDGLLIVLEEDFSESIRLPALLVEEEEFPNSIRIEALPYREAA